MQEKLDLDNIPDYMSRVALFQKYEYKPIENKVLGKGSFGSVYEVKRKNLEETVAAKRI